MKEVFDFVLAFATVVGSSLDKFTDGVRISVAGAPSFNPLAATINLDDEKGERANDQDSYGPLGMVARPLDPQKIEGKDYRAEVIAARTADGLVPIAWRDLRLNRALPNPKSGDIAMVGYGANFLKLAADGGVSIVATTDGTADGEMIYIQLLPKEGFQLLGPFGKLTYGPDGFHLLHHTGARIDLGGIGGMPAPLDTLGSYVKFGAAMASIESAIITLGPKGAPSEPAAKSIALQAVLTSIAATHLPLQNLLTKVGLALTALDPSVAADVLAVNALFVSASAAITAGALTIPSQSTGVT